MKEYKVQVGVDVQDSEWVWNNVPLQSLMKGHGKAIPGKILVKDVVFDGQGITVKYAAQNMNRILSSDDPNKFVHVSFAGLRFKDQPLKRVSEYIERVLLKGLVMNRTLYLFMGHSNSQLKSKSCYLYACGSHNEVARIVRSLGSFETIMSVSKRAKRIGLLFSSAEAGVQLDQKLTTDIDDVERNGHIFTDGCGNIHPRFGGELTCSLNLKLCNSVAHKRYVPSVFQIRYKGYKGTLVVNRGIREKAQFRHSMRKFKDCPDNTFSVVGYSEPFSYAYLNGELVTLLSTLGIQDRVFLKKQQQYFDFLEMAGSDAKTAFEFLCYKGEVGKAEQVLLSGLDEPGIRKSIEKIQRSEWEGSFKKCPDKGNEPRVRIMIPESRLLFGVCDFTGKLKEGEVQVRISGEGLGHVTLVESAWIIVGRNPCLHPADIQKFKVVRIEELDHLVDCIVFSVQGERDGPSILSGGDLDGDKFFVCWDKELIPQVLYEPYGYPPAKEVPQRSISQEDMIRYFAHYNNSSLGKLKNLYLQWLRVSPDQAGGKQCQELNALFSKCVDGQTIRIPEHLENPPTAQSGKQYVLDALCDAVRQRAVNIFKSTPELVGFTPQSILDSLLSNSGFSLTNMERFDLIHTWCLKNQENMEDYLVHFDWGAFTLLERKSILVALENGKSEPSRYRALLLNGLHQSAILTGPELYESHLHYEQVHWQLLYATESDAGKRLEGNLIRAMENFTRKLIVAQVDSNLKIVIYIPHKVEQHIENEVFKWRWKVVLFAFTSDTGRFYKAPSRPFKLSFDGGIFQLYESRRSNTFVWLALNNTSKGFPSKHPFKFSIALQKFNQELKNSRSLVLKQESKQMEIYVLSDADRVGHQVLDITMNSVDTTEIKRNMDKVPVEYDVHIPMLDWTRYPPFCKEFITSSGKFPRMSTMTLDHITQIVKCCKESGPSGATAIAHLFNECEKHKVDLETRGVSWDTVLEMFVAALTVFPLLASSLILFYDSTPGNCGNHAGDIITAIINKSNDTQSRGLANLESFLNLLANNRVALLIEQLCDFVMRIMFSVRGELALSYVKVLFRNIPIEGATASHVRYLRDFLLLLSVDYIGEVVQRCSCDGDGLPFGAHDWETREGLPPGSALKPGVTLGDFLQDKDSTGATSNLRKHKAVPIFIYCARIASDDDGKCFTTIPVHIIHSRVKVGDHLRFVAASKPANNPVQKLAVFDALVKEVERGKIALSIEEFQRPDELFTASWNIYSCNNSTNFMAQVAAIKKLTNLRYMSTVAADAIVCTDPSTTSELAHRSCGDESPNHESFKALSSGAQFDASQVKAVLCANQNAMVLIWGPPGTGKTTVIVEILLQSLHLHPGRRILVTAPTHNAVDNVLIRFVKKRQQSAEDWNEAEVVRVTSDMGKVSPEAKNWTLDAFVGGSLQDDFKARRQAEKRLKNAKVVFTTCSGAGVGFLKLAEIKSKGEKSGSDQVFDVVIVDEASQLTEPNAIVPLVKNTRRVVLVGDHVQLRPTVSEHVQRFVEDEFKFQNDDVLNKHLNVSLFERLYRANSVGSGFQKIMLSVQYRMHPDLIKFPSHQFYGGQLHSGIGADDPNRIANTPRFFFRKANVTGEDVRLCPGVFINCSSNENMGSQASKWNEGQVNCTVAVVQEILKGHASNGTSADIAVLTPYSEQKKRIKTALEQRKLKTTTVQTIDGFQGQEADVIVFSTVRCNESRELGFTEDNNRMNVALTRARLGVVLIGSEITLASNAVWKLCLQSYHKIDFHPPPKSSTK